MESNQSNLRKWRDSVIAYRKPLFVLLVVLLLGTSIRALTLQFMRAHLNDAAWFQFGSYKIFDRQARDILVGRQPVFFLNDPSRTDLAQYPPAFPAVVALIYKVTGDYSAHSIQNVQWLLDFVLSFLLIAGIATTAFDWRIGVAASLLVALSPLLSMYAAYPSTDIPTTWWVLGGNWLLLIAAKRNSVKRAFTAGVVLGIGCWFRVNPLYLSAFWAVAILLLVKIAWKRRILMGIAVVGGTFIIILPIILRNYLTFPDFTPTGGTIGVNLWEGLGETELGRSNGFLFGDDRMLERERIKLGLPAGAPLTPQWPDGIRRDRERTRESLEFIKQHPVWYAGVMFKRMWGMLKVAGKPSPYYGSTGINVTSKKCLSDDSQNGILAAYVNVLGMIQSVARYLLLPLVVFGIYVAIGRDRLTTGLLIITIFYYLVPGTAAHTEIRYVLPMHALLLVFGGVGLRRLSQLLHL